MQIIEISWEMLHARPLLQRRRGTLLSSGLLICPFHLGLRVEFQPAGSFPDPCLSARTRSHGGEQTWASRGRCGPAAPGPDRGLLGTWASSPEVGGWSRSAGRACGQTARRQDGVGAADTRQDGAALPACPCSAACSTGRAQY